jgi:GNAT superfamily N-acetyltransferase
LRIDPVTHDPANLDRVDLLARFDRFRQSVDGDGAPTERDGPVTRIDYPHNGLIAAPADTGLRGADLDALIARQRDYFAALGRAVEWKTYGYDQPANLPARLLAAGFVAEQPETVIVGSVAALADQPTDVPGVTIRETTDPADFAAIGELHTEVWHEDWTWVADDLRERSTQLVPDGYRVLVAEGDGRLVCAAWLVMRPGREFASLWGGSTLEAFRGRGIYRALVARRAAVARAAGYAYLHVDASDDSRPILERLGFIALTTTTPYVHPGPGD